MNREKNLHHLEHEIRKYLSGTVKPALRGQKKVVF